MAKMFELNLLDFVAFKRFMEKSPRAFRAASAEVLNSAGFGIKRLAQSNIFKDLTVRNPRFIKGSIRVQKARRVSIGRQFVVVGSIERPRFTGWEEQETGKKDKRNRFATLRARKNKAQRQVVRPLRFKKRGLWPTPQNFRGGARAMFSQISRSGSKVPFVVPGGYTTRKGRKLPSGVWRFGGGTFPKRKLSLLHRFEKPKQTKRTNWMRRAREKYLRSVEPAKRWSRAINRIIKQFKGR